MAVVQQSMVNLSIAYFAAGKASFLIHTEVNWFIENSAISSDGSMIETPTAHVYNQKRCHISVALAFLSMKNSCMSLTG